MADNKAISVKDFCDMIFLHKQIYYDIKSNKRTVTVEMLSDLLNVFGINPSWILDEKGDIYVPNFIFNNLEGSKENHQIFQEPENLFEKVRGIPFYEIDLQYNKNNLLIESKPNPYYYINVPGFSDCTSAVMISGDSMKPKYCNGDIMMLKKIEDLNIIYFGEAY